MYFRSMNIEHYFLTAFVTKDVKDAKGKSNIANNKEEYGYNKSSILKKWNILYGIPKDASYDRNSADNPQEVNRLLLILALFDSIHVIAFFTLFKSIYTLLPLNQPILFHHRDDFQ